jgi:hypothetical protein
MSEDKWTLLEGLARRRGYEVAASDDNLIIFPRFQMSGENKSLVYSWDLSDEGVESASQWLQSKRRLPGLKIR